MTTTSATPASIKLDEARGHLRDANAAAAMQATMDALMRGAANGDDSTLLHTAASLVRDICLLPDAITCFGQSLHTLPADAELHMRFGAALDDAGEPGAALEAFQRATEIDPDSWRAWYNLGEALREHGRPTDAIRAAQRALDIESANIHAQLSMARAQIAAGRIDDARARLHAITRQDPANADA